MFLVIHELIVELRPIDLMSLFQINCEFVLNSPRRAGVALQLNVKWSCK